ncbi:MAG: hypothetical protein AVDCRST_MAG76-30 [uncultured Acidimicrobiales bacterium]|uniref:Uncharacterized protein n=1 Tax=uncultured Acidimicrobiales bacterium TaxID=310071 RepID=A0A6J4H2E8_9ACTN|nr:MAG: hypothetical protein AVDCRST_MAG76-30 [uncultured Acidimicrobiales bacterium]
MAGPVLVVVALVALIPAFLVVGGFLMALTGHLFVTNAEQVHEGSELIKTNV